MSYTLNEINKYQKVVSLVVILVFIGCVISFLIEANVYSVVIGIIDFSLGVLLMGNFAEWEEFINTYSE
jgi:hypothetical protein